MIKKLFSLLLVCCMVLGMVPAVSAAQSGTMTLDLPDQVNPLFADVVFETELKAPERADYAPQAQAEYLPEDQAVLVMQSNLKNRAEAFTVYLETPITNLDYETIQAIVVGLFDKALVHTGNPVEGDYLRWQYGRWNVAEIGYSMKGGKLLMSIPYTVQYYTTAAQEAEVDQAVAELLNTLDLEGLCDYEKVRGIHEYIIHNVTYDHANLNNYSNTLKYTAYAALINGTSVCQGYAVLFYRLAMELGVDARVVPGDSNGDGGTDHSWNIVQMQGQYYGLDATFDSEIGLRHWFLMGTANFTGHAPDYNYLEVGFQERYPMSGTDFVHSSTETVTDPTCTEPGYTTYTCSCGKSFTGNETAPLDHAWDEGSVIREPSETEEGMMQYLCTRCGEERNESIPRIDHSHNYVTREIPATCTEGGCLYEECTLCGATDNIRNTEPLGHDCVLITEVEPTCEEAGYAEERCTRCNWIRQSYPIEATGHDWSETVTAPTCTEEGYTTYTCTRCGGTQVDDYVDPTGHSFEMGFCTLCGEKDPDFIEPPVITGQPVSFEGSVNDEATFTVEATGNDLTYQWYYSSNGGSTWYRSDSPGCNTPVLQPILRAYRDGYQFYCQITDGAGNSVNSDVVTMSVKSSDVVITHQPQDVSMAVLGQLYQFSVEAEGENLTYRWEVSTDNGDNWELSWNDGYDTAILNVRMYANRDGNLYRCVITSGLKTVAASETALLDLQDPSAEVIGHPTGVSAVNGETVSFHVEATGSDLTYTWYRSDDKGATWTQTWLTGYNTDTLTFVANGNRAALYMCKVTDGSGNAVWSNSAKLQLLSGALTILSHPESLVCAAGETATFTVEAQGDGLKYQWYASSDGVTWTKSWLPGYNTPELSFTVNATRAAKMYKCVITDAAGNTAETYAVGVIVSEN